MQHTMPAYYNHTQCDNQSTPLRLHTEISQAKSPPTPYLLALHLPSLEGHGLSSDNDDIISYGYRGRACLQSKF